MAMLCHHKRECYSGNSPSLSKDLEFQKLYMFLASGVEAERVPTADRNI